MNMFVYYWQDDEIPNDEKFNVDGTYVPRILFLGNSLVIQSYKCSIYFKYVSISMKNCTV